MAARQIPIISVDDYLDQEELSPNRHWYCAGTVTAMAGGTPGHAFLALNLGGELRNALRGRGCRVAGSDLLLQTGRKQMYVYPDVMVICGPLETMEGRPNVVTNPVFVAEVLSPATAADDRGVKSHEYRATPSILQFALLSQDRPLVEIHTRHADGGWLLTEVIGLTGECEFSALGCRVGMAALYEGVLDLLE
jgi:Uma2 family endonuclease